MLILFPLFVLIQANAQNEFAATAFYEDFKKIYSDAQTGFINCKGEKRKSGFEELASEYQVKMMLPLADSGKLVIPATGKPFVIYYFEPDKLRLKTDQRSLNLREAIFSAFDKPLYTRTETTLVSDRPFSNILYYTDPGEKAVAIFRQCIYFFSGKYYLSLEIRGNSQ